MGDAHQCSGQCDDILCGAPRCVGQNGTLVNPNRREQTYLIGLFMALTIVAITFVEIRQWAEAHEPSRLKWKLGGDIYADKPYTEVENPDIVSLGARERHVAVNVEGYTYASTNNVIVLKPRGKEVFRDIYVSINDQTGLTLDISDDGKQLIVKRQG